MMGQPKRLRWWHLLLGLMALGLLISVFSPRTPTPPPATVEGERTLGPECDAGFQDGWVVGKTDAWEGRSRDGQKAMRLGKVHGQGRANPAAYAGCYHRGYNEGWHAAKRVGAPGR